MTVHSFHPDTFVIPSGPVSPPGQSSLEALLAWSGGLRFPAIPDARRRRPSPVPTLDGRAFAQGGAAETMTPGAELYGLTDTVASDSSGLSDDELLGAVHTAERLRAHADWQQMRLLDAFAARQEAAYEASTDRGDKRLHREGEFGAEELGMELVISRQDASSRLDTAQNLGARLPRTMAGLRDGAVTLEKAKVIAARTWHLSDGDAATADETLADAAPGIRKDSLYRKASKLAHQLDPEAAAREKKEYRKHTRVQTGQENSGNFFIAGREMDAPAVLAARSGIWEEAARLRRLGADGTLDELRSRVFTDRLRGIDTATALGLSPASNPGHDDIDTTGNDDTTGTADAADTADATGTTDTPDATGTASVTGYGTPADTGQPVTSGTETSEPGTGKSAPAPATPAPAPATPTAPAPAALITLLVPASVAIGTSHALTDAGATGLLDSDDTRDLLQDASRNPRTRWCMTAVDDTTGRAIAHACIPGQHPWTAPAPGQTGTITGLLDEFRPQFEPIATGECDHRHREDRYQPSRKLRHLVHARTATCPAVGCDAQAVHNEDDHTHPWPEGDTDECNLSPPCPRHHHAKHAPGWKLEQDNEPGVMKWTTPSGRTYTSEPTTYDL